MGRDPFPSVSGVYRITIGTRFYIGSSISLRRRKWRHEDDMRKGRHPNQTMQRAYDKYGDLDFAVLEVVDRAALLATEQLYLDVHFDDPLCMNMLRVAGSTLGAVRSAETRIKMSRAQTGRSHSAETRNRLSEIGRGRTLTDEHRANIGAGLKGRVLSPEHLDALSLSRIGFVHSDAAKSKMRLAATGRRHTEAARRAIGDARRGVDVYSDERIERALMAYMSGCLLVGIEASRDTYTCVRRSVPSLPSAALIEARMGGWNEAKTQALLNQYDGIAAVVERLKGEHLFAHTTFTKSERGPIAAMVTRLMDDFGN